MDIWFTSSRTQKLFSQKKNLAKTYGDQMASRIWQRVADLKACASFREAFSIPGRLHALQGRGAGKFAMDLVHPNRLIIEPANEPLPYKDSEKRELDYDSITEITIEGIVDYH